ncbi:hypothetical protein PRK78_005844 [Emydomyces testavorans]|uniref:Ubiquitin-like domain-containing protein n=1 Tax=Emydomyces testavorans TaxID=2070801 RepID=A0AAF0IN06_9EURO|nr:hypothetical protein PRK78_005844 [Emydomyces testavorans]
MSLFFKKPSWAKSGSQGPSSGFYRRSEHLYSDIVAGERPEPYTSSEGESSPNPSVELKEGRHAKRRRVSSESITVVSYDQSGEDIATLENSPKREKVAQFQQSVRPTTTPSIAPVSSSRSSSCALNVGPPIILNPGPEASPTGTRKVLDSADTSDEDLQSEEEFPELARKARERSRSDILHLKHDASAEQVPNPQKLRTVSHTAEHLESSIGTHHGEATENPVYNQAVQILITSALENTKPLLVRRLLSQSLGEVRKAWCNKQGFTPEMTSSVFLTWKGRRLFDVTTCKSLGIQVSAVDDIFFSVNRLSTEDGTLRVHMEAVTQELFEMKKHHIDIDPDQAQESKALKEEMGSKVLRITLKSPNTEEFKVKVRPATQISYVLDSFRTAREVPPDKMIELHFDGARLDPESLVSDNDIDDLDCIDVVMKPC